MTLTTTTSKVYDIISNNCLYGFYEGEMPVLTEFLSSPAEKLDFSSKRGDFSLQRVTGANTFGFRLYTPRYDFPDDVTSVLLRANRELAALDSENPEATWHEKPFWAN